LGLNYDVQADKFALIADVTSR